MVAFSRMAVAINAGLVGFADGRLGEDEANAEADSFLQADPTECTERNYKEKEDCCSKRDIGVGSGVGVEEFRRNSLGISHGI
jgi:hypothetical protein